MFFVFVDLEDESPASVATVFKEYNIRIQFYEKNHEEEHTVLIVNGLRDLFLNNGKSKRLLILPVKDRFLEIKHLNYGYVGSAMDIPEISFTLEFFDSYASPDTRDKMNDIHVTETLKKSI